jgi:hypothetical protein
VALAGEPEIGKLLEGPEASLASNDESVRAASLSDEGANGEVITFAGGFRPEFLV